MTSLDPFILFGIILALALNSNGGCDKSPLSHTGSVLHGGL